ncbi:hypothetical protein COCC4DRAFT_71815 [Bipolaris maydis ATCC 48331]|uniref:Gag1-like clamp domain-containing protein n=2 Tax=Cochliobolus heterostrophus TaxID=5016 RepID=M2U599_COCH5|nr:uncharacterized protein COCC4DRAFT_71815 [Bipolaris maydis ATCC 48331]EMD88881.1 hypothetical protein COCHEDRAFT_1109266 [Bipolaris maydis C5]ENI05403.1 hypothetical protein COCC4DRAFT_71815 [Bipolaris maydis ATCC 48331]
MESNLSAARASRRFLDERIRNDWDYPDPAVEWSASDEQVRDAVDFRERYYGESESGDSDNEDQDGTPYKFDNPESIGDAVAHTREARKRRRRERMEREMKENEGLRIWVERRDVWTGAASVKKYGTTPETYDLVPVAPRLLDQNPIRASITPQAYSDIYQKIVVSSRTPSVPINLADMTKALVQGWKDADEWPPRVAAADPLAGKKRVITGLPSNGNHGGFIARHPHLEKGVDGMKRILHLNVQHNHENDHAQGKEV